MGREDGGLLKEDLEKRERRRRSWDEGKYSIRVSRMIQ